MNRKPLFVLFAALTFTVALAPVAFAEVLYVVGDGNTLISFNHAAPQTTLASVPITGLVGGDQITGIDFRPANGGLVALGSSSRLYRVDVGTGAASPIGSAPFTPAFTGTEAGLDFNPTVDRVRLVSNTGQNLRLNPDTGGVAATDTNLAYAAGDVAAGTTPSIVAVAYTNSLATATTTSLYAIDSSRDTLVRQGSMNAAPSSPNAGLLFTIGPLGVNTEAAVGFDISSATGTAFAALRVTGATDLYTIDLSTGAATRIGTIAGAATARGLAVAQALVLATLPVVGAVEGANGTSYRTEITLTNSSAFPATTTLEFFRTSATADPSPVAPLHITLAAGEQRVLANVPSQFGITSGTGAVRVSASRPVSVFARIYNDQRSVGKGTFGQIARGFEESERRTSGLLPALSNIPASTGSGARTNVGFFNPNTTEVMIALTAKDVAGATIGTASRVLAPSAHQQFALSDLFPGLGAVANVYVTFATTVGSTAGGALFGYASFVDNTSGDGSFIPAQR